LRCCHQRWLRKIGQQLKWVPALITSPARGEIGEQR
jgi:hypothetical protein